MTWRWVDVTLLPIISMCRINHRLAQDWYHFRAGNVRKIFELDGTAVLVDEGSNGRLGGQCSLFESFGVTNLEGLLLNDGNGTKLCAGRDVARIKERFRFANEPQVSFASVSLPST